MLCNAKLQSFSQLELLRAASRDQPVFKRKRGYQPRAFLQLFDASASLLFKSAC